MIALRLATTAALALPLAAQSPVLFTDVTTQAGIGWQQTDPQNVLASGMGAGGAFLDYDGDGWQDVLLVGGSATPALYRNLGNGNFADVSAAAGIDRAPLGQWHMSATVGDVDNDGDPDIYLGTFGTNVLFRNNGDGTFSDATDAVLAGLAWTTGAAFGDYDADGWLDLYIGNYVKTPQPYVTAFPNRLLHNNGDGTFSDVTSLTGTAGLGTTLAVSWTDFDSDGDVDLMVGNDFGSAVVPNRLYRNDGAGTNPGEWQFCEVSQALNTNIGIFCMGTAAGDIDRDLDLDYYFSNLGRNVLLRNDGTQGFVDITTPTGTENTWDETTSNPKLMATSWSVGFRDFDLDGWLDLYVSNGHLLGAPGTTTAISTPNVLYHHDGAAMTFSDVSALSGAAHRGIGRGACFADFDKDGDIDILQINVLGPPALLRNDTPNRGAWLKILPLGRSSARDATGTQVQLDLAGFSLVGEVQRNRGFESSSDRTLHFGLGAETVVNKLTARWPSGIVQDYAGGIPAGFVLRLVEPVVSVGPASQAPTTVVEGTWLDMTLELENHTAAALPASHLLAIRAAGQLLATTPVTSVTVPAAGSTQVPFRVFVPVGSTGGRSVTLDFEWTAFDGGGGFDQFAASITFRP